MNSKATLRAPVPLIVWEETTLSSLMAILSCPKIISLANLLKGAYPSIGKYSLSNLESLANSYSTFLTT